VSSATDNAREGDDSNMVRDGEGVRLPFSLRDSARRASAPLPLAGRTLRCTDTGRVTAIDAAMSDAIGSEAGAAGLTVEAYLRTRLHYTLERSDG
jgi:hypothetical protein